MKTTKKINLRLAFIVLLIASCSLTLLSQTVKDHDGKEYKTIKYGRQEWMAENLNVAHFQNGDPILRTTTAAEWEKAGKEGKPAWCYYNNDPENGNKYGKLYNWYAINDKRGLAPEDWRIPVNADWSLLIKNLLGVDVAGLKLKSKTGWKPNKNGSDNIGFRAIPGGICLPDGTPKEIGSKGQWWSNSGEIRESNLIYSIMLNDFSVEVMFKKMNKENGFSVRCLRDIK